MTRFRPCIDLHAGSVKQIVGGTLDANAPDSLKTNFVSEKSAGYFAKLYKEQGLSGSHVIMLGPGNDDAAREACKEWPNGLQVGGGIKAENARDWIDAGAEKVRLSLQSALCSVANRAVHVGDSGNIEADVGLSR